jgi:hypothetical protein
MKSRRAVKRVYIASPLRGTPDPDPEVQALNVARNQAVAALLCLFASKDGVAPFAPHLLYPLFLDDGLPADREAGIRSGLAFMEACEEVWVYTKLGISSGMEQEIMYAHANGIRVVMDPPCWGQV